MTQSYEVFLGCAIPSRFNNYESSMRVVAKELGIELLFLPPYSPNLNLIERLWKFTKRKVLYNKYYGTYDDFKKAIKTCLGNVSGEYKQELSTWMAPNFQTFSNEKILT